MTQDWEQVEKLLNACVMALWPDEYPPATVKNMVSGLRNSYGCWLDWVDIWLKSALDEVPDTQKLHGEFWGTYMMLKPFLFELYRKDWEKS